MAEPTEATVKALFSLSGNRCAFPECNTSMVIFGGASFTILGRICHIKGKKPGAKRYDPNQSEAERHSFSNLLLLCPTHHVVIDGDEETYTVEMLREMKAAHEGEYITRPVEARDDVVRQLMNLTVQDQSIKFGDNFERLRGFLTVSRTSIITAIRECDAMETTSLRGMKVQLFVKTVRAGDRELVVLVGGNSQGDTLVLRFAFLARRDLLPVNPLTPINVLRYLTSLFGHELAIGTRASKLFYSEQVPYAGYGPTDFKTEYEPPRTVGFRMMAFVRDYIPYFDCALVFAIKIDEYLAWYRASK
jgi:hypothetical protein